MSESTTSKIVHKLDKILHPGAKEGKTYSEGVGDTTTNKTPQNLPNDDRAGIGMGYGAAEGIDTRDNQYEHDLKQELGQRGPGAETRAGIGEGYAVEGGIGQGDNTMDSKFQKNIKQEMSTGLANYDQPASTTGASTTGYNNTTTTNHTTTGAGNNNTFNDYAMSNGTSTGGVRDHGIDSITPVGGAATSGTTTTTRTGMGVGTHSDRLGSTASSYPIEHDQTAHLTPGRRESAIDSALAAGHADHSRAGQTGAHSGYMASVLDPNAGRDART